MAEFVKCGVKEDKNRNRAKLTLFQILIHNVQVLVAQENAHIHFAALSREPTEHRQIVDDIAAPIFGKRQHMDRLRQLLKKGQIVRGKFERLLIRL